MPNHEDFGEHIGGRQSRRFQARQRTQPPVIVEPAEVAQPVEVPPPPVPTVHPLRAEYERLAKLVPTLKRDTPEFKQAMADKKLAAEKWNASK